MPRPPLRVLIVEDEAIIAMELEMLLDELGAEVVAVLYWIIVEALPFAQRRLESQLGKALAR